MFNAQYTMLITSYIIQCVFKDGRTLIHHVVGNGSVDMLQLLLSHTTCDVSIQDNVRMNA